MIALILQVLALVGVLFVEQAVGLPVLSVGLWLLWQEGASGGWKLGSMVVLAMLIGSFYSLPMWLILLGLLGMEWGFERLREDVKSRRVRAGALLGAWVLMLVGLLWGQLNGRAGFYGLVSSMILMVFFVFGGHLGRFRRRYL